MDPKADNIPPNIPPYIKNPPIARELGVLFGFLAASLVIMGIYIVLWRAADRRDEERDRLRREQLVAKGVHHGRGGIHEKMLDQEVPTRVELPTLEASSYRHPSPSPNSRAVHTTTRERGLDRS